MLKKSKAKGETRDKRREKWRATSKLRSGVNKALGKPKERKPKKTDHPDRYRDDMNVVAKGFKARREADVYNKTVRKAIAERDLKYGLDNLPTPDKRATDKGGTKNNYCKGGVVSRGQGKAKRGTRATKLR